MFSYPLVELLDGEIREGGVGNVELPVLALLVVRYINTTNNQQKNFESAASAHQFSFVGRIPFMWCLYMHLLP